MQQLNRIVFQDNVEISIFVRILNNCSQIEYRYTVDNIEK